MFNQEQTVSYYFKLLKNKPSDFSERYDPEILSRRPEIIPLVERLFKRIFPKKCKVLLDVGCGTGFYFPLLAKHCEKLIGIDYSKEMVSEAREILHHQKINGQIFCASAAAMPLSSESIDRVFSWDLLHHTDDTRRVLEEISRVLKPGGSYTAVEPNFMNPALFYYHARRRSEWGLFTRNQMTVKRFWPIANQKFQVEDIFYDNTVISFLNANSMKWWRLAELLTSKRPLHFLKFRYVLHATKRS